MPVMIRNNQIKGVNASQIQNITKLKQQLSRTSHISEKNLTPKIAAPNAIISIIAIGSHIKAVHRIVQIQHRRHFVLVISPSYIPGHPNGLSGEK